MLFVAGGKDGASQGGGSEAETAVVTIPVAVVAPASSSDVENAQCMNTPPSSDESQKKLIHYSPAKSL